MIKLAIIVIPALIIATGAQAQSCYNSDGYPCIGTELDQWQAQQKQQQQLQEQLDTIQNNQYQMENQLNQLQSEQDSN